VRKFRVRCQNANSICRSFHKRTIFHANAFLILCTRRNGCNYARLSFNYRNLSGALCQKGWEMNVKSYFQSCKKQKMLLLEYCDLFVLAFYLTFHKISGLRFAFIATMVNCKIWRTASQKMYALKLHFWLVQFWKLLIRHKSHFDKRKFVHEVCAFRIKICVDNIFFFYIVANEILLQSKIVSSLLLSKLNVVHMVVDPNQVPTSKWFRFSPFWSIF